MCLKKYGTMRVGEGRHTNWGCVLFLWVGIS
nr:MAG TPA: hypothetical protein [Caudoviricetes sp.]DAQ28358.1 MAG TPA: hypothetical protein [Caudoviricetes sp.]